MGKQPWQAQGGGASEGMDSPNATCAKHERLWYLQSAHPGMHAREWRLKEDMNAVCQMCAANNVSLFRP